MASQGPNSVTTGATLGGAGGAWENPTRVVASDDSRTVVTIGTSTELLAATGPGFAIPSGATINGIVVEIESRESSDADSTLDEVFLTKDGTSAAGSDMLSGTQSLTTTEQYYTVGGATELWGTTWTEAEIEASTFGALIRATKGSSNPQIDHVRITVYYTEAGGDAIPVAWAQYRRRRVA